MNSSEALNVHGKAEDEEFWRLLALVETALTDQGLRQDLARIMHQA
jgi:hypothetical protein